jgi:hypothetical protein
VTVLGYLQLNCALFLVKDPRVSLAGCVALFDIWCETQIGAES